MRLEGVRHIHFIGICGTAMATLASMLQDSGYQISGSDQNVFPPMSTFLQQRGVLVASPFSKQNLIPKPDLVVVGNVISRGNVELEAVLNERMFYTSSADLMKEVFIRGKHSVLVAGTHGKTTATSLVAWILTFAGLDPTFMVGGIPKNFQSSYRLGASDIFVCEGDEYDTAFFDKTPKFLHYLPTWVIINNIEFDHADIYRDLDEIELQFRRLVNLIPQNGLLLAGADSEPVIRVADKAFCAVQTFGVGDFFWSARNISESGRLSNPDEIDIGPSVLAGKQTRRQPVVPVMAFDIYREQKFVTQVATTLLGIHNVRNILAAFGLCFHLGVAPQFIADAIRDFTGVKRRLDLLGNFGGVLLFDDFAHHPTAIRETLSALRRLYAETPIHVAFEPRSATSRRKVFQSDFAESLALADTALISDLYDPSKIAESERLDPFTVAEHLRQLGRQAQVFRSAGEIVEYLMQRATAPCVIVIMSNGGFGGIHQKLADALAGKFGSPTAAEG
ncbi:MAG TPA: Mur ligase family protein [Acidobacteriota bacterium]|jgi:UDP-N-acetylmuramate: L-alanyl-gamma-D-glutamyl-meso-diaminopimelate ligase|nr:Mur ligase family protein [Acidobacteriota bacterium]